MCVRRMSLVFGIIVSSFFSTAIAFGQNLEIHYINVGWGDSVFVKGSDGTTVLLEAHYCKSTENLRLDHHTRHSAYLNQMKIGGNDSICGRVLRRRKL
jgi:hypothetical protein